MLAPARIPVAAGKKMAKTEKNVSPRKSGPMFSHMIEPEQKVSNKSKAARPSAQKPMNLVSNKSKLMRVCHTIIAKEAKGLL